MEVNEEILNAFEQFLKGISGQIRSVSGINQVTKAIERQTAKLVVIAQDTNPQEIVMHLPTLCKDRSIVSIVVPTKEYVASYLSMENGRKSSCAAIIGFVSQEGKSGSDEEHLKKFIKELEL